MGPYCKFCGQRCFVRLSTVNTPNHIAKAYFEKVGALAMMATCARGQAYEKQNIGYCYADIKESE